MTTGHILAAGLVSILAGLFGSLLGLGGGLFVTPLLTGPLGFDIHIATSASIVAVIATSSAGGAGYLKRGLPHVKLAMVLETGTVLGAIIGTLLNGALSARALAAAFALILVYSGVSLSRKPESRTVTADPLAIRLGLCQEYPVAHVGWGVAIAIVAGVVSGLIGVGGGIILVPAMVALMGVPIRTAAATSTFMIGVTGVASASIQLLRSNVDPVLAAPVVLGIFVGATLGPRIAPVISPGLLRALFLAAIGLSIVQMILKVTG